ncbi:hypothetical protein [Streptomyces hebeiensis]
MAMCAGVVLWLHCREDAAVPEALAWVAPRPRPPRDRAEYVYGYRYPMPMGRLVI